MNRWTLSLQSVRTYWRTQLTVAAGLAVAAVVLTGSLIVGDSVRHSLHETALQRIGKSHFAVLGGERFFMQSLADRIGAHTQAHTAPVLQLSGSATHPDNGQRANQVQVLGVDQRFWDFSPGVAFKPDEAVAFANPRLARQLKLTHGDEIVLRIETPSAIPKDALLSSEEDLTIALRIAVVDTVPNAFMGRFSLRANQAAPYSIFLPIDLLQTHVELPDRANLVLVGQAQTNQLTHDAVQNALDATWTIEDGQLSLLEAAETGHWELRSKRVFIADPVVEAALHSQTEALPVLTYFVNGIQHGTNDTPYSMVAALPPDVFEGHTLADSQILINRWLADDLDADVGAEISLRYYVMAEKRKLTEDRRTFTVAGILPFEGLANDPLLMPDLPGISDSENCREWEPGFPINLDRIRNQDEAYWDAHEGTPKAFITLDAGQAMWRNRYGALTAVRFKTDRVDRPELATALQSSIRPQTLGIHVSPIRKNALQAGADAMDFGQLFVSFSFFLVLAALLLAAMLFAFNVEQRQHEAGVLRAAGFSQKRIRGLFLREGVVLSAIAGVAGVVFGTAYTRVLLHHLSTTWREAIGEAALLFHAEPMTLAIGAVSSLVVGVLTIHFVLRKQFLLTPVELLRDAPLTQHTHTRKRRLPPLVLPAVILVAAVYTSYTAASAPASQQGPRFFSSGMLLLVAIVSLCHVGLMHMAEKGASRYFSKESFPMRNLAQRSRRSLATIALLAAGTFMVIAVSAHRMDARLDASQPTSGTGGFAYVAEFTSPILRDLNAADAQVHYGIDGATQTDSPFTHIRVNDGDETSCLNLNRPQRPRIWGVDPARLAGRFTFMGIDGTIPRESLPESGSPWALLDMDLGPNRVPAIGDNNSIMWSLGQQVGGSIPLVNEFGEAYELVLIAGLKNSMFQGGLLISESQFLRHHPSSAGYRMVLIDDPGNADEEFSQRLNQAFRNQGLELRTASARLNAFNTLQNTYLAIFQSLGALGLLLGSIGLGIVVLRNVLERRHELAMLRAVGYSRAQLTAIVFKEHAILLAAGIIAGLVSAALALAPSLRGDLSELPLQALGLTLLVVIVNGLIWTALASRLALRGNLISTLRSES